MARSAEDEELDWAVRRFVYRHIIAHGLPPTATETAAGLGLRLEAAQAAFERLDARHAILLDPETRNVRIANPFSGVPTSFRVRSGGREYWANCAFDALGIPAALHVDAEISARFAEDDSPLTLSVADGRLHGGPAVAHFPLPFRQWYDDQTFT